MRGTMAIGGVHPLAPAFSMVPVSVMAVMWPSSKVIVELPGLGPGLNADQSLQRHGVWLPSSGLLLPLPRLIQIRPAAKAQIVRLAVVVLRELRHRQVPPVGRQLGPAVDGLSRRQHQERRQDQRRTRTGARKGLAM